MTDKVEKAIDNIKAIPLGTLDFEGENGGREFEFKNEQVGGGLVFEYESIAEPIEAQPEPRNEEPEPPKRQPSKRKPKEDPEEEFSIPDAFAIDSKYDTPITPDTPSRIWTTYVPRFTEASQKYRMVDDPRPRKEEPEAEEIEKAVVTRIENTKEAKPEAVDADTVDPTAELEETADGLIVEMSRPAADDDSEKLNVFKFGEEVEREEEPPRERTVEDELRDIERLIVGDEEEEEEIIPEPEVIEDIPKVEEAPKQYSIPDPGEGDLGVVDYFGKKKSRRYSIADPDGASDASADHKDKISSEFTHPSQRDGFKDKFLDMIMSIKIRLVAALVFFVGIVAYELLAAFGVIPETVLASSSVTGALAMYDLLFASCLFVFALPEIIRAGKYLFEGRLLPELMVPVGYLVVLIYSLVVIVGSYSNYALYGTLFGISVISALLSSYFRTEGDFTAFKMVSKNSEKRILDKKMTRNLPEENIALDGLVDEYKSRTARIFRAGFITDFFKKTSRTTEKTEQTGIILSVSFGVALVCGVVAFFVLEGLISAVSAFALVYLLGAPSFAILSRKLSYYDAQNVARSEESTVVGEESYLDFSDVDVVAFEDTEIFGPDDVNLKRFMLYCDRDNMERAMRQMCSLFAVVGGPLYFIFTNSLDKRVRHSAAVNAIVEEDGISGDVAGNRIAAGTEEYMRRHGVAIPDGAARAEGGIDTTKVMYASENGEVYAKFYIRYSFSEEFTMLLPVLKEKKIVPLIYTRDPNVSNELLKTLSAGSDCMRVMKRLEPGASEEKLYSRVSAGVVTYGDKINAIDVVLLTKKYKKYCDDLSVAELYAMGLGTAAGVILSLFTGGALVPLISGAWQALMIAALRIIGLHNFSVDKNK